MLSKVDFNSQYVVLISEPLSLSNQDLKRSRILQVCNSSEMGQKINLYIIC